MSDAGDLSAAHASFNSNKSCGGCHQAHKKTGFAWLAVAFSDQDMSEGCLSCHRFAGDARAAHQNPDLAKASQQAVPELECTTCHTEHLGRDGNITAAAGASCSNCHAQKIDDFADSHPPFSSAYPYSKPHNIYFDHKSHIGEYFVDKEWTLKPNRDAEFAALAAKACTTCHEVEGARSAVKPTSYKAMCSGCHQQQIHDRPLIAMTGDEASPVLVALAMAAENELADDSEALALGTIQQMKEDSLQPLMEMTGADSAQLWAGLSAVEMLTAASAWAAEEDMEQPMPEMQQTAGWHTGENDDGDQSLFYRATTHADPVVQAWIETFVRRVQVANEDLKEPLSEALDSLLDAKYGPGACGKCHSSGIRNALQEDSRGEMLWGYQTADIKRHTPYAHAPHINLTGNKEGCASCHQFAKGVDVAPYFEHQGVDPAEFVSAFSPIKKQTCSECHNPKQISDSCLTCHQYHGKSDLRIGFMPTNKQHNSVVSASTKTDNTQQPELKASQHE